MLQCERARPVVAASIIFQTVSIRPAPTIRATSSRWIFARGADVDSQLLHLGDEQPDVGADQLDQEPSRLGIAARRATELGDVDQPGHAAPVRADPCTRSRAPLSPRAWQAGCSRARASRRARECRPPPVARHTPPAPCGEP